MKEIKLNTVHNMDCLEYMKTVPDNFFDLILTDPPYGIKIGKMNYVTSGAVKVGGAYRRDYSDHDTDWDNFVPTLEYFEQMKRISKHQIIFGGNYFSEFLEPTASWIIWDKRVEDKYSNDFADCEMAWNSDGKPSKIFRFLYSGMIQQDMRNKDKRFHPTQKPVELFKMILRHYTEKNNYKKIFDPFAGSGTTADACISLNLDYVICELNSDYCKKINKRLEQVQGSLF